MSWHHDHDVPRRDRGAVAEIINLRKLRKAKRRAESAAAAATNRVLHGRTTAERERQRLEQAQARQRLDGAKTDGV